MLDLRGFALEGLEMNKIFMTTLLLLTVSLSALAAEGFSSLEEQMTGKEYMAAGLDKLSPQELDALNAWIRAHSLATLDQATAVASTGASASASGNKDMRGLKTDSSDKSPISSTIKGKFNGWDGQTVFKLENGMIWAQADKDKFYIKEVENPKITIEPGMLGSWYLQVEGSNSRCKVKRIQ